jgi:L-iditol 2-dehydrogenase
MQSMEDARVPGADVNVVAVMQGLGRLDIEERSVPEPGPAEVLVEVSSVGVCGSDVHFFEHGRIGLDVVEPPHVLGHEVSGRVVGHGAGATTPPLGSRVAVEPSRPCGTCPVCRSGRYNLCPHMRYFSAPPMDGAFARFVTAPQSFAFPVPESVSDDAAALIEPLSVVLHAARRTGLGGGDRVLIAGAGPIGLLMAQVSRAMGATQVIVSDTNPRRLTLAAETAATETVDVSTTAPQDAVSEIDAFIECSGNPAALASGIECVRPGGTATVVGMSPAQTAEIPIAVMQAREISLVPTFRFANVYAAAIDLVASGAVDPTAIVTGHFSLEETDQALRAGKSDPNSVKPIVHPWG